VKLGRFSQQRWSFGSSSGPTAHPGPPGALRDGADLESSVTGAEAEAPAYYQTVPPGRIVARNAPRYRGEHSPCMLPT
jgi:hypothetical protein